MKRRSLFRLAAVGLVWLFAPIVTTKTPPNIPKTLTKSKWDIEWLSGIPVPEGYRRNIEEWHITEDIFAKKVTVCFKIEDQEI